MPALFDSGFFVKEPAWHGLGVVVQEAPSIAEGIKLAEADWNVITEPVYRQEADESLRQVKAQVVLREDTRQELGVVGPQYQPLQNVDAFNWFEPFIESGECQLHTAGILDDCRKVWVLAKLAREDSHIREGDDVAKFIMLSNSHDGSTSVRVGFTPIRIVCANTLAMAHNSQASKLIRVRHTSKVKENIENIREIMNLANQEFEATAEQYRLLANTDINQTDLQKYVRVLFGEADTLDTDISTRKLNQIKLVEQLFETGFGADVAGRTWWAAYNAYNQFLNYEYGRSQDSRLNALWFGQNANANADALKVALKFLQGK